MERDGGGCGGGGEQGVVRSCVCVCRMGCACARVCGCRGGGVNE